jgi:hypothetical protein
MEGQSVRLLSGHSGHSESKIIRIIRYWLNQMPKNKFDLSSTKHIIFDGSFIRRRTGVVAVMDANLNRVVAGDYGIKENSIPQLLLYFNSLKLEGLCPKSATIDGNPHVIKALKIIWPSIIIQRCLVHIQRQGLMWCRISPKRTDARHLRKIFLETTNIRDTEQRDKFIAKLKNWENRFGTNIAEGAERGPVFSDLKRARSMLIKAMPNMFHYLEDGSIPFSTNGLEGYFSRLKMNYRQHRGLSPGSRRNYFRWYFNLKSR